MEAVDVVYKEYVIVMRNILILIVVYTLNN